MIYIDSKEVRKRLKKRKSETHKGDYGHILIVAGSKEMTGAAILCAKGAFRSGAGLVYMYVPESVFPIMQISVPEAICIAREANISFERYDAIAFGPGLGVSAENAYILKRILREYDKTLIIDADGLNTISAYDLYEDVRNTEAKVIITPHTGEAARLAEIRELDRSNAVYKLSDELQAVAVLKGSRTLVTGGNEIFMNTSGNPGMATAGSGDVLTGVIASLSGQGLTPLNSAVAGVYLHGLAGDLAAEYRGQWGIMASDLAEFLSFAIKNTLGE